MKTGKSIAQADAGRASRFSVAPMMDWTDRHCRFFHRLISRHTLLYTEMIPARAVVFGNRSRLIDFDIRERPVALQIGGNDPNELAQATRAGVSYGYDEINLNVGCPSSRVREGKFGAVLMKEPQLVAKCLRSMVLAAEGVQVTVKCRIGVDDQVPSVVLPKFLEATAQTGISGVIIHARKAWLSGLNPKQNRTIPPLDYDIVLKMKEMFPGIRICLNGGIESLDKAIELLESDIDGVMVGRAAYRRPVDLLMNADDCIFGQDTDNSRQKVISGILQYIDQHLEKGGRATDITRHIHGLFAGTPGARSWRRGLADARRLNSDGSSYIRTLLAGKGTLVKSSVELDW